MTKSGALSNVDRQRLICQDPRTTFSTVQPAKVLPPLALWQSYPVQSKSPSEFGYPTTMFSITFWPVAKKNALALIQVAAE